MHPDLPVTNRLRYAPAGAQVFALPLPSGARRAAYCLALTWVVHSWTAPAACRI